MDKPCTCIGGCANSAEPESLLCRDCIKTKCESVKDLPTGKCKIEQHVTDGACYWCCDRCNYQTHRCHFCGEDLRHNEYDYKGNLHDAKFCRPDLFDKDGNYVG